MKVFKERNIEWKEFSVDDSRFKKTIFAVQQLFDRTRSDFSCNQEATDCYSKNKTKFKVILKMYDSNSPFLLREILDIYKAVFVKGFYYRNIKKIASLGSHSSKIA